MNVLRAVLKVFGVGINDADYTVQLKTSKRANGTRSFNTVWVCPYYTKWKDMLRRCYDKNFLTDHPTYSGCTVCEDWLTFSKFRAWCVSQEVLYGVDVKQYQLDKDLLHMGNKEYNPNCCLFVPKDLNTLLTDSRKSRGKYPIGVTHTTKGFQARISKFGKCTWLGRFETAELAHQAWKNERVNYLKEVSLQYTGLYGELIREALNKKIDSMS